MRRFHLLEIEDQPWCPRTLRDAGTDYLQFVIALTQPYAPIGPRLGRILKEINAPQIIDLCSGAAGPWLSLEPHLRNMGLTLSVCLTDRFPNLAALQRAHQKSSGRLAFIPTPIDATRLPENLDGFRTLFSSFHHFAPADAKAILGDAVRRRQGIGIFEGTHRSVKALVLMLLVPLMVLLATPFIRPFRWSRLFWTYLIPILPMLTLFDGLVSCLRTYTPAELQRMVEELEPNEFRWEIGEEKGSSQPIPITYLIGYPVPQAVP